MDLRGLSCHWGSVRTVWGSTLSSYKEGERVMCYLLRRAGMFRALSSSPLAHSLADGVHDLTENCGPRLLRDLGLTTRGSVEIHRMFSVSMPELSPMGQKSEIMVKRLSRGRDVTPEPRFAAREPRSETLFQRTAL